MEDSCFIPNPEQGSKPLCGIGKWRPRCLQPFANPKCFLFFFSLLSILQGAYFTYFVGILTTLEKRYSFDSRKTGIILIADNLSPALFGIILGYFGKKAHKPRIVSGGMMITVLSCFISASPFFIFGTRVSTTVLSNQLCGESIIYSDCSLKNESYYSIALLFIANFFNGFGSTAYYTLGTPYIDDNVKKKNSPLYIGTTFSLRIIGPFLGFMLSSFCLRIYENPFVDPGYDDKDSRWIGAWWMGFVFLGLAIFLVSLPIALFPKRIASASSLDDEDFGRSLMDLLLSLKKLIQNPVLCFHTLSIIFQINGLFGYFVYMPKYMESQYHQTASSASFYAGTATTFAMFIGVFLSGYFIKKFQPKASYLVGYVVVIEAVAGLIVFSALFLGCHSEIMTSGYPSWMMDSHKVHNFTKYEEYTNCYHESQCNCGHQPFYPICDRNGKIHKSPCFAGCRSLEIGKGRVKNFYNCSCIHTPHLEESDIQATSGFCAGNCEMFLPYLIVITIAKMLSSTMRVGNVLVTLRCVDEKDKSLTLGAVEFFISVFATIPYPLFYGYLINQTCSHSDWNPSCGSDCKMYSKALFRNYLHTASACFIFLAFSCDLVVLFLSSRLRNLYGSTDSTDRELELQEAAA